MEQQNEQQEHEQQDQKQLEQQQQLLEKRRLTLTWMLSEVDALSNETSILPLRHCAFYIKSFCHEGESHG